MSEYGTPFVESEIVLAWSAEDFAHARMLIEDMTGYERRQFYALLGNLREETWRIIREKQ